MRSPDRQINKGKAIVAYVPVLHEGYRRFFEKYEGTKLLLLSPDVTSRFKQLTKDLRALPPEMIREAIQSWEIFDDVSVVEASSLGKLGDTYDLVMPDEDVMHEIAKMYLPKAKIAYDSIFLRWDKHKSTEGKPVEADQKISKDSNDVEMIDLLNKEAAKSSDWWRHVAAAIVKNGKVLEVLHNKHVPFDQMPYINGDPRSDFSKGVNLELSTALHCEASLIAGAAKNGTSLDGSSMYVTTFPCPPCAKLIAYSGVKKLYYSGGYGVLDGESILKSQGVEIIFVDTDK